MRVTVNGNYTDIEDHLTVGELLQHLNYAEQWMAVAVDGNHVPRHKWNQLIVRAGQCVEVVSPMQGG